MYTAMEYLPRYCLIMPVSTKNETYSMKNPGVTSMIEHKHS